MYFGTREETVEQLVQLYELLGKKRILMLDGPITPYHSYPDEFPRNDIFNAPLVADSIMALNILSSTDPIWLIINTPGGFVDQGLVLYDAIKTSNAPVYTVGRNCYSIGAILLSSGVKTKRYIYPSGRVMMHFVSGGVGGDAETAKIQVDEMKRQNDLLMDLLVANGLAIYKNQLKKLITKEKWLSAKEAVDIGIADDIMSKDLVNQMLGIA